MMLNAFFADLHIHIGRDMYHRPVKITGSKTLTLSNILEEANVRKGIHLIGVVDCHVPSVQEEIENLIQQGKAEELSQGGIRFGNVTLLLGSEIEIYDENCQGPIHVLCFLPTLAKIAQFTAWLRERVTNIQLSSQRYYGTALELQQKVKALAGIFIPAHVFTPFKSLYGKGVQASLKEVFDPTLIDGIELGLSSDSTMADQLEELHAYSFLSNSDAHSLKKIGREYQEILLAEPNFTEFFLALKEQEGRKILRNFGFNPMLGKYYSTVCVNGHQQAHSQKQCPVCGVEKFIMGVAERIKFLANATTSKQDRPPYFHHVPLEYLPKLGLKTYEKLIQVFHTEMNILHEVTYEELLEVIPSSLAKKIIEMRKGNISIQPGGGGTYGKVK